MNKILSIIFAILIFPALSWGAPSITGDGGQAVTDGGSFTITGSGFGSKDVAKQAHIIGPTGYVESGTDEAVCNSWPTNWGRMNNGWPDPVFDTSQAHSGTKSIRATRTSVSYAEPIYYHFASTQSKLYVSFWGRQHVTTSTGDGQWKVWRLEPAGDVSDPTSGTYSSYIGMFRGTWLNGSNYRSMMCKAGDWTDCFPSDNYALRYSTFAAQTQDTWMRFEGEYEMNSAAGVEDGVAVWREYKPSVGRVQQGNTTGWESRDSNSTATGINYVYLQNYQGNGITVGDIWIDDVYVSWGDQYKARVEFCDAATWANVDHCEIQPATAWATGSVTVNLNRGNFGGTDSGYLYIVDSSGVANVNGYGVTFGDEGGEEPPPADTTAPTVVNHNPSVSATGVSKSTNITFDVTDATSNYDASSTVVYVNTIDITSSCTIGSDSPTVSVSYNPPSDFTSGQVITVRVTGTDVYSNAMDTTWTFTGEYFGTSNRTSLGRSSHKGAILK